MRVHYIYRITNLINGKYYIGKHSTDNIDDNYFGSGTLLLRAFKKYGKENFKKDIIQFCDTESEAYKLEGELVTITEVKDDMCYNVIIGGVAVIGAKNGFKGRCHSDETKKRMSLLKKKLVGIKSPRYGTNHSDEAKSKMSEKAKGRVSPFKGKKHSKETREKLSLAAKKQMKEKGHPSSYKNKKL